MDFGSDSEVTLMDRRFRLKQSRDKSSEGNMKDTIFGLSQKWGQVVAVLGIIVGVLVIIGLIA